LGRKFPEVKDAVAALAVQDTVVDGEIVALDDKGRSSFQLLQGFDMGLVRPPIVFYAFDLLRLNGKDLQGLPIEERKAKLEALLKKPPGVIRYSVSFTKKIEELLSRVRGLGLEGLIGKRTNSRYEAGKRTGAWVKIKLNKEQEFVIGGYTEPEGSRKHFGALLVAFYEGKNLKFAGRAGTANAARTVFRVSIFTAIIQRPTASNLRPGIDRRGCAASVWAAQGRSASNPQFNNSLNSRPLYTGILQIPVKKADICQNT
jgi:ATP-dependent DNA ligase